MESITSILYRSVRNIGNTLEHIDKEKLGEECHPVSVCTDRENNVYIADYYQHKLHVLSAEDGTVLSRINLDPYGIVFPVCVRISNDFIYYVSHANINDTEKCQIRKLAIKNNDHIKI